MDKKERRTELADGPNGRTQEQRRRGKKGDDGRGTHGLVGIKRGQGMGHGTLDMGTWDELERLLLAQGRDGDGTVRTKYRTKIGRRAGITGMGLGTGHGVGNSSLWWCVGKDHFPLGLRGVLKVRTD